MVGWVERAAKILGPPVVPFSPLFWGEGSPTKIDKTEKQNQVPADSNLKPLEDLGPDRIGPQMGPWIGALRNARVGCFSFLSVDGEAEHGLQVGEIREAEQ